MDEKTTSQSNLPILESVNGLGGRNLRRRASDAQVIQNCLDGCQEAWCTLIERYRSLIFSIPFKYGFTTEDSAEIFQEVCLTLIRELPRLREPSTLPAWLIKVTSHRCSHWRAKEARYVSADVDDDAEIAFDDRPQAIVEEIEKERVLREAVLCLRGRCRALIQMLFFSTPPVPYEDVAERLGVATGSIGFLRKCCLRRLRCLLEERGVRQVAW